MIVFTKVKFRYYDDWIDADTEDTIIIKQCTSSESYQFYNEDWTPYIVKGNDNDIDAIFSIMKSADSLRHKQELSNNYNSVSVLSIEDVDYNDIPEHIKH